MNVQPATAEAFHAKLNRSTGNRSAFPCLLVVLVSAWCFGCSKSRDIAAAPVAAAPLDSNIVAMVNGAIIPRQAVEERRGRGMTITTALEELIAHEAIYQKALAEAFDRQPDIQARIKKLIIAQFREKHRQTTNALITEAEVQAAYQAENARFQTPAMVRGAIIFIDAPRSAMPEKREELRQRAERILSEARAADHTGFPQVVARHSEDQSTRYRGGDTGWLGSNSPAYDAALFTALNRMRSPGEFAPLVETPRGYYIARLMEKRSAERRPLAEVKEALHYQLGRQKVEEAERDFHAWVKNGLEIKVNQAVLEKISTPAPPTEPPPMPGSISGVVKGG